MSSETVKLVFKPLGAMWPREQTPADQRRRTPFIKPSSVNYAGVRTNSGPMPVSRTYKDLRKELAYLNAASACVIQMRAQGIRADEGPDENAQAKFPGVMISFTATIAERSMPLKFCTDVCQRWQDNLRAIVLTLERLRLADLYGVTKSGEQYTGWRALPAPLVTAPPMTADQAARFIASHAGELATTATAADMDPAAFAIGYRAAAKKLHPDAGGKPDDWLKLQEAKAVLERHHAA